MLPTQCSILNAPVNALTFHANFACHGTQRRSTRCHVSYICPRDMHGVNVPVEPSVALMHVCCLFQCRVFQFSFRVYATAADARVYSGVR